MEMGGDELSHIRTSVTSILHTHPLPCLRHAACCSVRHNLLSVVRCGWD